MASGDDRAAADASGCEGSLRIVHVLRAPVGGLFRHVADLSRAQSEAGHKVGLVVDSTSGGDRAQRILDQLSPSLSLGVTRLPMRRPPHPDDLRIAWLVAGLVKTLAPDVVHGHGAKGGLYARLPALSPGFPRPARPCARVYTPHGGSLHYRPDSVVGRLAFSAERMLSRVTDFIPFESDYARRLFIEKIGAPPRLSAIVHNGLSAAEFAPANPAPDAADFLFLGEMRAAKGVEDLLRAFALLPGAPRLALVGSGHEEPEFRALAERLGVGGRVAFLGPTQTSQEAFRLGRIMVVPSRAESLPYAVLEAVAAQAPVVATRVGGIPEIFGPCAHLLAPPRAPQSLAAGMQAMLEMEAAPRRALTAALADLVRAGFSIEMMSKRILQGYRDALVAARSRPCAKVAQPRIGE